MAVRSGIEMAIAVVLVSVLSTRAAAQSGCNSVLIGMAPCLRYVSGSSSSPSSSCCSQLSSVVRSQPQCLCTVLNGGVQHWVLQSTRRLLLRSQVLACANSARQPVQCWFTGSFSERLFNNLIRIR
ncbi:Protein YLS3 [Morella rubra]|uniref:Protein YLS3 n=1 Tax=Morella rubra TaxID=262757 RepID=A0A6A1VUI5_9ROSI|nr:Protein YLS3 [Morella rubra]